MISIPIFIFMLVCHISSNMCMFHLAHFQSTVYILFGFAMACDFVPGAVGVVRGFPSLHPADFQLNFDSFLVSIMSCLPSAP